MAFRVARAIGAVAVKLCLWLLQDLGARLPRALAMRVDILAFRELHVDRLCVFLPPMDFGLLWSTLHSLPTMTTESPKVISE